PNVMLDPEDSEPPRSLDQTAADPAASAEDAPPAAEAATEPAETDAEIIHRLNPELEAAATAGTPALGAVGGTVGRGPRRLPQAALERIHKPAAAAADKKRRTT